MYIIVKGYLFDMNVLVLIVKQGKFPLLAQHTKNKNFYRNFPQNQATL